MRTGNVCIRQKNPLMYKYIHTIIELTLMCTYMIIVAVTYYPGWYQKDSHTQYFIPRILPKVLHCFAVMQHGCTFVQKHALLEAYLVRRYLPLDHWGPPQVRCEPCQKQAAPWLGLHSYDPAIPLQQRLMPARPSPADYSRLSEPESQKRTQTSGCHQKPEACALSRVSE